MRKWLAATAMAGLSACLENPGVDQRLADKPNVLIREFDLGWNNPVRVRLFRSGSLTGLFLRNDGPSTFDTLEFFLQISLYGLPGGDYGSTSGFPMLIQEPLAERHVRLAGLRAGEEADLGTLTEKFPSQLGRLEMIFYPIRSQAGAHRSNYAGAGFYSGRFSEIGRSGETRSGTLQGLVIEGSFHFWLRSESGWIGSFRSLLQGDTLFQTRYLGTWYADSVPRLFWRAPSPGDSTRLSVHLHPYAGLASDTLGLETSMVSMPAQEWPPRDRGTP